MASAGPAGAVAVGAATAVLPAGKRADDQARASVAALPAFLPGGMGVEDGAVSSTLSRDCFIAAMQRKIDSLG